MIGARLAEVEAKIAAACSRAGRRREQVTLIGVAKTQPDERVLAAYGVGVRAFGENYVQELDRHRSALETAKDVAWHFIGHLQTNKAKKAAERATWVHTLDAPHRAQALGKACQGRGAPLGVLIEVNLGGEGSKSGCAADAIEAVIDEARAHSGLRVAGLMCIPPPDDAPRRWFAGLRTHAERLRAVTGLDLPELSMGMSSDYEDAILEGATMVRVGTAIFGERLA